MAPSAGSKITDSELVERAIQNLMPGKDLQMLVDIGINLADSSYDKVGKSHHLGKHRRLLNCIVSQYCWDPGNDSFAPKIRVLF